MYQQNSWKSLLALNACIEERSIQVLGQSQDAEICYAHLMGKVVNRYSVRGRYRIWKWGGPVNC